MGFRLGGPIDLKPTHMNSWTVFCNIFSRIPHLTIFSALKYAAPHPFHISYNGFNQSVARYVRCTIYLNYPNWNTPSLYITRGGWGWGAVLREGDILWKKKRIFWHQFLLTHVPKNPLWASWNSKKMVFVRHPIAHTGPLTIFAVLKRL